MTFGEYLFKKIQDLSKLKPGDTYYIVIGTDIFPDKVKSVEYSYNWPLGLYPEEEGKHTWCTLCGEKYPNLLDTLPKKLTDMEFVFKVDEFEPLFSALYLYPNLEYVKDRIKRAREEKKEQLRRELEELNKKLNDLDKE